MTMMMTGPQSQYDPGFASFGGGPTGSILHPVVLALLVVVTALIFLLPRRYVIVPLILGVFLVPAGQNLYFGGIHLYIYRILILMGLMRVLVSKPSSGGFLSGGISTLDRVFLVWTLYEAMAVVLLFGAVGAAVNQAGFLIDALGGYFLLRSLIRGCADVRRVVIVYAVVCTVAAMVMLTELQTGKNILGYLGGIREVPEIRMGRIRAQGIFQHSILAGSFGATCFPLFLWLWKQGKAKLASIAGAITSSFMVYACASSTPVGAWLGSILAISLWPVRKKMRWVRWGIVAGVVALQLVMKAPVWYALAHIDFAGGSSGWNRANLLDTFARHIGNWWLIGTHDNVNWGWDMWDQCNQFVTEGETGGLVALGCLIAALALCFSKIGKARKAVEGTRQEWLFWLLGAAVFAQVLAFVGVDYFDQTRFGWYALLALIPAATVLPGRSLAKPASASPLCDAPSISAIDEVPEHCVLDARLQTQIPSC